MVTIRKWFPFKVFTYAFDTCAQVPYGEPLIASPDHLLLYCHVPKTASTAWMQVLALVAGEDQQLISDMLAKDQLHKFMLDHRSLSVQDVNAKLDAKQERFLFTRHPFAWVASAFTDKFVRRREKSFYIPMLKFKQRNKLRKKDQDPMQNNKQQQISFEDFVDFVMHEINEGMLIMVKSFSRVLIFVFVRRVSKLWNSSLAAVNSLV